MVLEKALALAKSIAAKRAKFGKLGRANYSQDELQDAIAALYAEYLRYTETGLSPDEIGKLKRQLAAANARVAKVTKREDED